MAITIPSDLELFKPSALLGHVPGDSPEPLHTLLRRTNWHYANHRPALVNMCPHNDDTTAAAPEFVTAVTPSADGLDYQIALIVAVVETAFLGWSPVTLTVEIDHATAASTGPWSSIDSRTFSITSEGVNTLTPYDVTIPASAAFLRFKLSTDSATARVQVQNVIAWPALMASITGTPKASGFKPYDDTMLQSPDGHAVHTEYLNRCRANVEATLADRSQTLLNYAQDVNSARYQWTNDNTGAEQYSVLPVFHGCPVLTGKTSTAVTVRARATKTGTGSPVLRIGQVNGASVELAADGVDRSAVLELSGERPIVFGQIDFQGKVSGTCRVFYISIEYKPTASAVPVVSPSEPAPPARLEYLATLEAETMAACLDPYAMPTLQTNFYEGHNPAGDGRWHWRYVIPPGTEALRGIWTRSLSGSGTPHKSWAFNTTSGATGNDVIRVDAGGSGSEVYEPMRAPFCVFGSVENVPAPTAPQDRAHEILADRQPRLETFHAYYAVGFSGEALPVADIADVP